ncbi:hypothetical protein [Paenibacillus sp. NPDC058071]|uniref:hypothetical protein n=1 Tax=Paenibacillus sp. NPDC058071 TaxID=3346326 RepID=UPI0036DE20FC
MRTADGPNAYGNTKADASVYAGGTEGSFFRKGESRTSLERRVYAVEKGVSSVSAEYLD